MTKRLSVLLVALLALGFAVAGCGDDDDDDKAKETTPAATTPAATTEDTTAETTEDNDAASGVADSPQAKQAIEDCKKQADANSQLSSEAKSKIGEVCEEAGSGDADGAVKATREACEIIIEDTTPAGPAQETALDACKASTKTP